MMERKQFTFYGSFAKALSRIRDDAERAKAYDTIINYALFGIEPDLDSLPDAVALAFELVKPTLDSSKRKAESGRVGGSAKQSESESEANAKQSESKPEANDKQTESKTERSESKPKQTAREKEKEGEKEKENECYIPPTPQGDDEKSGFATFWRLYPRKEGKGAARKAWEKIKPSKVLQAKISAAVLAAKRTEQWQRDGGQYIPHPATWLNQERWDDEPPDAKPSTYDLTELEDMATFDVTEE